MNRYVVICILAVAALLEAGGDAIIRAGLKSNVTPVRIGLFVFAAVVLFAYGWIVNAPPWDFGELIGLYVVFFFIAAQLVSWLAFGQPPNTTVLMGGALIVTGGIVIAFGTGSP